MMRAYLLHMLQVRASATNRVIKRIGQSGIDSSRRRKDARSLTRSGLFGITTVITWRIRAPSGILLLNGILRLTLLQRLPTFLLRMRTRVKHANLL